MKHQLIRIIVACLLILPTAQQGSSTTSFNTKIFLNAFTNPYVTEKDLTDLSSTAGVDIHATNNSGQTALMLSALYNYEALAESLLNQNANVNTKDSYGRTALMYAAQAGASGIAEKLIAAGAKITSQDLRGNTVQDYAGKKNTAALLRFVPTQNDSHDQVQAKQLQLIIQQALQKKGQAVIKKILAKYKNQE